MPPVASLSALAVRVDPAPRVLIVDDSAVARAVLSRMVVDSGRFAVAYAAASVAQGLAYLAEAAVDVILLDIEMPGVDGLSALPALLAAGQGAKVLIVSSACDVGATATVKALALGAADTLVKPGAGGFAGRFGAALAERLERLTERTDPANLDLPGAVPSGDAFDIVAIGASTGGIHALSGLLGAIPADFQRPILITQHLPASFSPYFAAQMALLARRPCDVADDHLRIRAGRIVVAAGDAHLVAAPLPDGDAAVRLSTQVVPNGNLPSVDPMFESLAAIYGPRLLAVVLSGMGRDGLAGAERVRAAGGTVVVQDRDSSVIWGMPGAIVSAGLANAILPPPAIGAMIAGSRAHA